MFDPRVGTDFPKDMGRAKKLERIPFRANWGCASRGDTMIDRFRDVACASASAVLVLGMAGAAARPAQEPASPNAGIKRRGPALLRLRRHPRRRQVRRSTSPVSTARANRDVGVDVHSNYRRLATRVRPPGKRDQKQRLRYSELNNLRDAVQRVRAAIQEFWGQLRAAARRGQGPGQYAGARASRQQHRARAGRPQPRRSSIITSGCSPRARLRCTSANLRIDNIINAIQDIRRKNFATNLFRPVPGIYSYQTWARVPDFAPLTMSRLRDLVAEWWDNVTDRDDVKLIGLEALLLWLVLAFAAWYGVRRLRRWRNEEEPPFWRRASSAAGVILLRTVPIVVPIIFLYAIIAEAHALPQRVDRMFYSVAQSIIIIAAVNALVFTVLAPRASHWRLIPAADRAAQRICGLVLALTLVYGAATLIYVATRLVQAPFSLTIAVAVPSCLLLAGIVIAILFTPLEAKRKKRIMTGAAVAQAGVRVAVWVTIAAIVASTGLPATLRWPAA